VADANRRPRGRTALSLTRAYTVACSSAFRAEVEALARRRRVSPADLARAVLLLVPTVAILAIPDPGEPDPADRETVTVRAGRSADRRLRRKPRLQLRLPPGYDAALLRRALALALEVARGGRGLALARPAPAGLQDLAEEVERLRLIVAALAGDVPAHGIASRADALHALGFAPGARPDERSIRARYRLLAQVFHPDRPGGNAQRMARLNAAAAFLRGR
jgi:hypothetical protein